MENEKSEIKTDFKPKPRDLSQTIPGYKINEYMLVLNPNEALRDKIMNAKQYFFDHYKNASAVYSKPHVTLANFVQYQMMEDRLINSLEGLSMACHPIKVEMKDYGSFPSHTIYINITSKVPVQNLIKSIRTNSQRLMKLNNDNKPHFIMEPHLTIARKLLPWQYEQGWLEFSHKQFTGRFIADAMLLLKRPVGEMKYQIARRFDFQNLPVTTKQGDLFS